MLKNLFKSARARVVEVTREGEVQWLELIIPNEIRECRINVYDARLRPVVEKLAELWNKDHE